MTDFIIGVDGGGTKTHAILVDSKHRVIDEIICGPANIRNDVIEAFESIQTSVDKLLIKHRLQSDSVVVCIGVAGFSFLPARTQLEHLLEKKYKHFNLTSDCHIALLSAHRNEDGAVVICGTGVVGAFIRDGQYHQLGGWGFPHGDLGGAAYLGLEVCKLLCKAIDGIVEWSSLLNDVYENFESDYVKYKDWLLVARPGDYASITELLLNHINDDIYAKSIINFASYEVKEFIKSVYAKTNDVPLQLMGGLARIYFKELHKDFPKISVCKTLPALGATYLKVML